MATRTKKRASPRPDRPEAVILNSRVRAVDRLNGVGCDDPIMTIRKNIMQKDRSKKVVGEEHSIENTGNRFNIDPNALRTTDVEPGETGPSGFPVVYNSKGEKVEVKEDGNIQSQRLLRRSDHSIGEAISELSDKVWYHNRLKTLQRVTRTLGPRRSKELTAAVNEVIAKIEDSGGRE
jgi:hypothetical protein